MQVNWITWMTKSLKSLSIHDQEQHPTILLEQRGIQKQVQDHHTIATLLQTQTQRPVPVTATTVLPDI